jgi:hypothetical protein
MHLPFHFLHVIALEEYYKITVTKYSIHKVQSFLKSICGVKEATT